MRCNTFNYSAFSSLYPEHAFHCRLSPPSSSALRNTKLGQSSVQCRVGGHVACERTQARHTSSRLQARRTAVGTLEQPEPEDFPPEYLLNCTSSQARRASVKAQPVRSIRPFLQVVQLSAVLVLLILTPAKLFCHTIPGRAWVLTVVYMAFFGSGTLQRMLLHGELTPRKQDAQVQTQYGRVLLISFVVAIVAGHWASMAFYGYCLREGVVVYSAVQTASATLLAAGFALHIWAAASLGKAYDRLVKPDKLIKSGPYAWCQHPIYTSYMMLFIGYAGLLGSIVCCLLFHVVCLQYYQHRIRTEAALLEQAFGNEYKVYAEHTGAFVPKLT